MDKKEYAKHYYETHKDRFKNYAKVYYEIHKEEYKDRYLKNRDRIKERNEERKDDIALYHHLYNLKNYEKQAEYRKNYYRRRKNDKLQNG